MDIKDLLNNEKYLKIPLVGNSYCRKKPSSKDTTIKLVFLSLEQIMCK